MKGQAAMKNEWIKNQNFGIEIEMTGITKGKAQKTVAKVLGSTNTGRSQSYDNHYVIDQSGREWKCENDSSIRTMRRDGSYTRSNMYSVELVSPILTYDDIPKLQEIIRALKKAGARVNDSCGIHIHIDGANHTAASLFNLTELFVERQSLIYTALDNNARAHRWCRKISPALRDAMKASHKSLSEVELVWYSPANDGYSSGVNHTHYNPTRYHGLNLHAFFSKGTVEFRLFNSTLHAGKIKAYIQFCLAISGWAISTKRVYFKDLSGKTEKMKVDTMRAFLKNRLGLEGDEFKTCRIHMMAIVKQNAGIHSRNEHNAEQTA